MTTIPEGWVITLKPMESSQKIAVIFTLPDGLAYECHENLEAIISPYILTLIEFIQNIPIKAD